MKQQPQPETQQPERHRFIELGDYDGWCWCGLPADAEVHQLAQADAAPPTDAEVISRMLNLAVECDECGVVFECLSSKPLEAASEAIRYGWVVHRGGPVCPMCVQPKLDFAAAGGTADGKQ